MPEKKLEEMTDALNDLVVKAWDAWDEACSNSDIYAKICTTNLVHDLNGALNALAQLKELMEYEELERETICSKTN